MGLFVNRNNLANFGVFNSPTRPDPPWLEYQPGDISDQNLNSQPTRYLFIQNDQVIQKSEQDKEAADQAADEAQALAARDEAKGYLNSTLLFQAMANRSVGQLEVDRWNEQVANSNAVLQALDDSPNYAEFKSNVNTAVAQIPLKTYPEIRAEAEAKIDAGEVDGPAEETP